MFDHHLLISIAEALLDMSEGQIYRLDREGAVLVVTALSELPTDIGAAIEKLSKASSVSVQ